MDLYLSAYQDIWQYLMWRSLDEIRYYFTYLKYHHHIRNMIYTNNWIERLNKDFRRTLKMRNSMPSPESVLTLLSKVAMDKNNATYTSRLV